jgi:hypothetical protein
MPAKLAYRNFTRSEFRCKCGKCDSTGAEISDELLDALQALRTICEFPFIVISSGYRCPSHPAEKNKDFVGAHGCGLAVDIAVSSRRSNATAKARTQYRAIHRDWSQSKGRPSIHPSRHCDRHGRKRSQTAYLDLLTIQPQFRI